jgi:hypothetical protein
MITLMRAAPDQWHRPGAGHQTTGTVARAWRLFVQPGRWRGPSL